MSTLSRLSALLLVTASAVAFPVPSAHAESVAAFEAGRLLEMIPATGVVGDGTTLADLYFLALDPNGIPLTGLTLKGYTTTGSVGALEEAGRGLWKFTYSPPKVDAPVTAELIVKGKIGKEAYSDKWTFPVVPSRTRPLSSSSNPSKMTLGVDTTATLSIKLATGDRQSADGVELVVAASCGKVESITNLGGGLFSALYTPPKEPYAQVALITIAERHDPGHTLSALAIPLSSKLDVAVTTTPNSRVIVKIGDSQFGPIAADSKGRAKVPLLVPPGVMTAETISVGADGTSVSEPLDLKLAEARRIALVPVNAGIPADSRVSIDVHAAVVTPDGRPDTTAMVVFNVTAGTISGTRHEGNGVYGATYTPPNSALAQVATLSALLADRPTTQTTSVALNLVGLRPGRVELVSDPVRLAPNAASFKLTTRVTGPEGTGLPARTITLGASGARSATPVKDAGNGDYLATFTPTGRGPVEVNASVALAVSGNPLWRLLLVPSTTRVTNDGLSSSLITVAAVDEFGYPVPNVPLTLRVMEGDGSLPTDATTNAAGVAQVYYTAGRAAGLVGIEVTSRTQTAVTALFQAPDELTLPTLPVAGSRAEAALVAEWRKGLGTVRIERE